jgi:hypothetical protein
MERPARYLPKNNVLLFTVVFFQLAKCLLVPIIARYGNNSYERLLAENKIAWSACFVGERYGAFDAFGGRPMGRFGPGWLE